MIQSAKAYMNEIPGDWKEHSLKFGLGFLIGGLSGRGKLLTGTAFASANFASSLIQPVLKKMGNKDARETIDIFTRNFIYVSICAQNPVSGLAAGSLLATLNIVTTIFNPDSKYIDKKDFKVATSIIYFATVYQNNPLLGLRNGGMAITARVICKIVYPLIESKIEQYKFFEKTGINRLIKDLPSGWTLGCLKSYVSLFFRVQLTANTKSAALMSAAFPLGLTYYHTKIKPLIDDEGFHRDIKKTSENLPQAVEERVTNWLNKMSEKTPPIGELVKKGIQIFESIILES